MSIDFGPVPAGSTLPIMFTAHGKTNGENITISNLAVGDILIYKGTSMTQRSSTSGFALLDTDGIDIDSLTGVHGFSIDLSDNTDSGFFAVGSFYTVVLGPFTVDGQTVYHVAATFRIVAAESVAGKPKVDTDTFGGTAGTFASGRPEVNTTHFGGSALTQSGGRPEVNTTHAAGTAWASGAITSSVFAAGAINAAKLDPDVTTELQTGLATAAALATAQADLDTLTGADGAVLATSQPNYAPAKAGDQMALVNDAITSAKYDESTAFPLGAADGSTLTAINLPDQTMNVTGNITGNLSGSVGSVTGNVGGNVAGTIGGLTAAALKDFFDTDSTTNYAGAVAGSVVKEIADNAGGSSLTAAAIADEVETRTIAAVTTVNGLANNSITAAAAAPDFVTEVQNGLATGADLATVDGNVDAIKAKTDSLTFTVAGQVDGNIQSVNDVEVTGNGQTGTEWGPA